MTIKALDEGNLLRELVCSGVGSLVVCVIAPWKTSSSSFLSNADQSTEGEAPSELPVT